MEEADKQLLEHRLNVFLAVANHLLAQMRRSIVDNRLCLYRSDEGLKCAVGCLISDEHYHEDLEKKTVSEELVRDALERSGVRIHDGTMLQFVGELQFVHDYSFAKDWPHRLMGVAREYGLVDRHGCIERKWNVS